MKDRGPGAEPSTFNIQLSTDTLYRIAALAGSADDPRAALGEILGIIADRFHATSGSIALLNPDSGRLVIEVQRNLPADAHELDLRQGQGVTGWVALHGKPQRVADVATDNRYIRLRPEARAEMAAPMIGSNSQVVGVVNLDSDTAGGFTDQDLQLLVTMTDEATRVMQSLWQRRHLQGKARQLETLLNIGHSLVAKLRPQELMDTVTRDAQHVMQYRASALYLHDANRESVRLASIAGADIQALPADEIPLDSAALAAAIRTRRQVEFPNIQSLEFADVADLPRDPALRSALATPLLYEKEVLGVLVIFSDQVHRFNNDEKRLYATLANLAAVTLQNVRLYARVFRSEESLRKNEQLTTLGLLAAEIAHEIRNPLTVIKLLHGHLGLDFPEGDQRRTDVRVIGEKLDQLEAIVTRVLDFGRTPGSLHSRWNVAEMISDTIVLTRLKLAQQNIHLRFDQPSEAVVVDAHKGQIQQVLINLMFNSAHAMPSGGAIGIATGVEDRGGLRFARIDVSDTGTGIPDTIRDRVFDSFLSGRPDGTGLGLAIAKRILRGHEGDIALVSTGPSGTTMRFTLPLAKR